MDYADLKNKSKKELEDVLKEEQQKLFKLRLEAHSHRLKQVHTIKVSRKVIARIHTLLATKQA